MKFNTPVLQYFLTLDVGTNGEIVIGNNEWMVCCSASAGPAFEGGGIKCGMRATRGAVEKVKIINGKVSFRKTEEIARRMTYFKLSVHPSYMHEFVAGLFLPHTQMDLFPTVKEALARRDQIV